MNYGEKRKFPRLNISVDIVYTKLPTADKPKLSQSKNISKGGICLIVYEQLQVSDLLELKIFLPEYEKPINATGKIAWLKEFVIESSTKSKRFDVGIEFAKVSNKDKQRIDKYIFSFNK